MMDEWNDVYSNTSRLHARAYIAQHTGIATKASVSHATRDGQDGAGELLLKDWKV